MWCNEVAFPNNCYLVSQSLALFKFDGSVYTPPRIVRGGKGSINMLGKLHGATSGLIRELFPNIQNDIGSLLLMRRDTLIRAL